MSKVPHLGGTLLRMTESSYQSFQGSFWATNCLFCRKCGRMALGACGAPAGGLDACGLFA